MAAYLVVVESPAKARTIQKYLGKDYQVIASYGHVRDLIPKEGAVDPNDHFKMHYQEIERNQVHVASIEKCLKKSDGIFLAPDPDREGEAIAWHIQQILSERGALKGKTVARVVFHEITKNAIQNALQHPRVISMNLVNAQQARRALDYLFGFTLSPLLWRKVRTGLSAGRVQSPALRFIVEREKEIKEFVSREYWTIQAEAKTENKPFTARLIQYKKEKLQQFSITTEKEATEVVTTLKEEAQGWLEVLKVSKRERKRTPAAPFITSTLQQEAARKLGFSAQRTMQIAQQLYEGIDTGEGPTGLITYMRTDSVNLAQDAIAEIRNCIKERYGKNQLPSAPRIYKTKTKNAQEAHEAIRPTEAGRIPDSLKKRLSIEQYKLYDLIWKRTIASQMIDATLHTVAIDLGVNDSVFRANGSSLVDPGFMAVYQETEDDKKPEESEDQERMLPPLEEGQRVQLMEIKGEQHFTEPPPRYTEATLVKTLEEHGIGRPSTYASIISTLKNREYVTTDKKRFKPSDVAIVVNRFLTEYFPQYVDYHFTANLEDELDSISRGDKAWIPLLEEFWGPFKERVDYTAENVQRSEVTQEKLDEKCPKCEKPLSIRLGKRGRFIGCTGYPDCDYTRNLNEEEGGEQKAAILDGRQCPKCKSNLVIKHGRYGKFIACSGYPKCKHIEPIEKPKDTGVPCPECKKGNILERKSRRNTIFYSCERYPQCQYALWNRPLNEPCPLCHWPILSVKITKRKGAQKMCPQKSCKFSENYLEGSKNND